MSQTILLSLVKSNKYTDLANLYQKKNYFYSVLREEAVFRTARSRF
ncbi:hypothetical protein PaecuDRAFT_2509 [Paenibacillus curdlanolyticus YK9]|uniref:Uncharacterized protein n=1 Tax=Paenibacillus curdlanolyticus YK9 TaxID=717606 RepID=E0IA20_9BACL|nr:hypothetical protein [Paenibacillus curdlanolyticus]EFM10597.1 hypothetical protein PaecuDRAFT_2509 [Paenibacillus curdlanolyticus YK9]